jgi:HK97 family phage major capsid protein
MRAPAALPTGRALSPNFRNIPMKIATLRAKRELALEELQAKRTKLVAAMKAIAQKKKAEFKKGVDDVEFDRLEKTLPKLDALIKATTEEYDEAIEKAQAHLDAERKKVQAVAGQDTKVAAEAKKDKFEAWTDEKAAERLGLGTNKGLIVGGICKAILMGSVSGNPLLSAKTHYGENHPVTLAVEKSLVAGIGGSGGFMVPPDYVNEIIELLRPMSVVRSANPRSMPMPRGTMTLPAQTAAATATYGSETGKITTSQQQVGQLVATYKKLKALVPVSNDLMRFADPAADAFVRDDLTKVMALREDLAFLTGEGTQDSPRGFTSFANAYALSQGGTVGVWSATADSTAATGGNFVTANETPTLTTVAAELGTLVNNLDTANVPDFRRKWFMHPRSWNFLNNIQNSLGVYVYRDELSKGTLLGYPFAKSTQIPINIWDATGTNKDCSFVMLVEMTDATIFDSMQLELAVSREGTFTDTNGVLQSAFANDQTLIRAIAEHDFLMRHDASVAVDQFVRWAPAQI